MYEPLMTQPLQAKKTKWRRPCSVALLLGCAQAHGPSLLPRPDQLVPSSGVAGFPTSDLPGCSSLPQCPCPSLLPQPRFLTLPGPEPLPHPTHTPCTNGGPSWPFAGPPKGSCCISLKFCVCLWVSPRKWDSTWAGSMSSSLSMLVSHPWAQGQGPSGWPPEAGWRRQKGRDEGPCYFPGK